LYADFGVILGIHVSSPRSPRRLWHSLSLVFGRHRAAFPSLKWVGCEVDHSPLAGVEFKIRGDMHTLVLCMYRWCILENTTRTVSDVFSFTQTGASCWSQPFELTMLWAERAFWNINDSQRNQQNHCTFWELHSFTSHR